MLLALAKKILPSWKNALLSLLAAGMLILAFPDFDWWWMAWIALVPLMCAVEREGSVGRSFLLGWLFGTAFFFGTCWWLTYAPIHYASIPWPIAYLLILVACIGAGVFPGIFAAILSHLLKRFGSWAFLAAPFVWVFTEFLRYWLTGNNWNAVGYSQAFSGLSNPSILDAQIGGVYLSGFALLVLNSMFVHVIVEKQKARRASSENVAHTEFKREFLIYWIFAAYFLPFLALVIVVLFRSRHYDDELNELERINTRRFATVLIIPIALSCFVWANKLSPKYSIGAFNGGDTVVIAVQPNVPMSGMTQSELENARRRQFEASLTAFESNLLRYSKDDFGLIEMINDESDLVYLRERYSAKPKVVILPESPMNFMYNDDREFQEYVRNFTTRNNVSLLFNSAEPDPTNGKYFNSAVMIGADGKMAAQYDKIYLLPFGEAVPVPFESVMPAFVGNFSYGREYDLLPFGDAAGGIMICFESHFGQLGREYVSRGADVLIEMTNDGYLGPTPVLRQHLANAVFRAVETNRPVLRVTNVGITAYINARGEVMDPAPVYQEDTRVWTISKSDGSQTFYVRYGDWFAWLCSIVTLLCVVLSFRRRMSEPPAVAGG